MSTSPPVRKKFIVSAVRTIAGMFSTFLAPMACEPKIDVAIMIDMAGNCT